MDTSDRIYRYLAACPPAISKSGGHNQTFTVACALVNGFGLSGDEALNFLRSYNQRCQPEWSESELLHKVNSAISSQHSKPRGHLLGNGNGFKKEDFRNSSFPARAAVVQRPMIDPVTAVEKFLNGHSCTEADLWEASPIRPPDDFKADIACVAHHLFLPGEHINVVTEFSVRDGKAIPSGFGESLERQEATEVGEAFGGPSSESGGWMRINPTNGDGIKDTDIVSYRHLLLEFDNIPIELQLSFFSRLPLPISIILTSGGKSVHAWVKLDAKDLTEFKDSAQMVFKYLERFGVDGQNKNPARLSRLVGGVRKIGQSGDGKQRILFLNPKPSQESIL